MYWVDINMKIKDQSHYGVKRSKDFEFRLRQDDYETLLHLLKVGKENGTVEEWKADDIIERFKCIFDKNW